MRHIKLTLLILVLVGLAVNSAPQTSHAQNDIYLTLTLPNFVKQNIDPDIIAQFEADHPGVKVVLKGHDLFGAGSPTSDLEDYLDTIEEYVSEGDVLYVNDSFLTLEAIRAGYYLDLTPLASADSSLNVADFNQAAYESFLWDNGLYGLPVSITPIILSYDPAAFDAVGIPYPNENWTLDDFESAVRTLTQYDENGEVSVPGLSVGPDRLPLILRSLYGNSFYDLAGEPAFDDPTFEALITQWAELQEEGLIGEGGASVDTAGNISFPPMQISVAFELSLRVFSADDSEPIEQATRQAALLPGGTGGMEVNGLVVSKGTQSPQQAYELIKYLSNSAEFANSFFGGMSPARQSLADLQTGGQQGPIGNFTPEQEVVIDQASAKALPLPELRYGAYLNSALTQIRDEGLDAHTALQEAEITALNSLQTALDRAANTTIFVTPPPQAVDLANGEIALNFGIVSNISPMPNQQEWDQMIEQFAATDPEVGLVNLSPEIGFGEDALARMTEQYDCFVMNYNAVPGADLTQLLSLDPFLSDDPSFNQNDVVGNVLSQLQRDNRTWAYPLEVKPQVLFYDAEIFNQLGLVPPSTGWTVEAFEDALHTIVANSAEDTAAFSNQGFGSNYLLMLIAAYGGLPIDFRTDPPTINFTDPTNVEAIRQVLDLAKEGYIDYQALDFLAGGGGVFISFGGGNSTAIYSGSLDAFGIFGGRVGIAFVGSDGPEEEPQIEADPYEPAPYPRGSTYTPLAYEISTGYISANAENPEACYRFLSTIAQTPNLLSAMPAFRSQINNPEVIASQGQASVDFYNQFDLMLQDPTALVFREQLGGASSAGSAFHTYWLNRAFDRYVLEDADLEFELSEAELLTRAYQDCIATIPPYDPFAYENPQDYNLLFMDCARRVDPSIPSLGN